MTFIILFLLISSSFTQRYKSINFSKLSKAKIVTQTLCDLCMTYNIGDTNISFSYCDNTLKSQQFRFIDIGYKIYKIESSQGGGCPFPINTTCSSNINSDLKFVPADNNGSIQINLYGTTTCVSYDTSGLDSGNFPIAYSDIFVPCIWPPPKSQQFKVFTNSYVNNQIPILGQMFEFTGTDNIPFPPGLIVSSSLINSGRLPI